MSDSVNIRFEMSRAATKLREANEDLYEAEEAEKKAKALSESAEFYRKRSLDHYAEALISINKISDPPLEG